MIKATFLALLMSVSCSAFAQWTEVGRDSAGDVTFVNFDSLKKEGSKRTYWTLTNFAGQPNPAASIRAKELLDCKSETYQVISMTGFSKHSAQGNVLGTISMPEVTHIAPNTTAEIVMKAVCSK